LIKGTSLIEYRESMSKITPKEKQTELRALKEIEEQNNPLTIERTRAKIRIMVCLILNDNYNQHGNWSINSDTWSEI